MPDVRDNGIGLPPGPDIRKTTSTGLQLVNVLVERLEAKLDVGNKGVLPVGFPSEYPKIYADGNISSFKTQAV